MTEPRRPRDLDETLLDEGRVRRFPPRVSRRDAALAETLLDEGRRRRDPNSLASWPDDPDGLPEPLTQRYKVIRRLDVPASQADLFLLRVVKTGEEVVLKRYLTGRDPHPDLVSYLSTPREHVVRFLEFASGYEVMEYVSGGSLLDWREVHPAGFDAARAREIAQQVSAVLVALHRQRLVHRDIKPANIVLRSIESLDLAVVDFGIAGPLDDTNPVERPNPAYQPPESILLGQVGVAGDWWSLGMTLLELASGEHPFEGLAGEHLKSHFGHARTVDVSGIPDEPPSSGGGRRDRLRNLCQGLLTSDPARRWGEREVSDWLVGRDPQVPGVVPRRVFAAPTGTAPAGPEQAQPEQVGAAHPYGFDGVPYHFREDLAQGLATAWNRAVEVLFTREGRLDELRAWLEQFTDDNGTEARRVVESARAEVDQPGRVRLLRIVRALAPTWPATYRNQIISRRHLLTIAHRALANDGDAGSVLADLWNYRLLPTFDTALPAEAGAGGEALADLDPEWRAEQRRWSAGAAQVDDPGARRQLDHAARRPDVLAVALRAALRQPDDVAAAQQQVRLAEARLPEPVPWFSALARQPDLVWVALLVRGQATSQARSMADQREAEAARVEALQASALFHRWSRCQNRPAALGWAVAGVCLMAAGWIALVAASDAAGWSGDTAIGLAWVGAAVCAAVSLAVECLLAAEVGGRFHPRSSIPGAGVIALGPIGGWMRRAWLPAAAAIAAVLAGITLVALLVPQVIAVGTMVGHLLWVVRRWGGWRAQVAGEESLIAEAERSWPSGMDAAPAGAARGADT
jgi:hypothetical protein